MAGTGWQSSDLLSRFNTNTGRPASGDTITDPTKYQYLADAQQEIVGRMCAIDAKPFLTGPVNILGNTSDGGQTYTFGTDGDGYAIFPLYTKMYVDTASMPGGALRPGIDYLDEGTQIRMPNGLSAIYPGLYWYGVAVPQEMSATIQPVLQPPPARAMIAYLGAANFGRSASVRNIQLAEIYDQKYEIAFGRWMATIIKHFKRDGQLRPLVTPLRGAFGGLGLGSSGW